MSIKIDFSALIVSVIAVFVSVSTFIYIEMKPYDLLIAPPAITQVNTESPGLLMDMSFHNSGSSPALISAIRVNLYAGTKKTASKLFAQQEIKSPVYYAALPLQLGKVEVKNFVTRAVAKNETWEARLLFQPYVSNTRLSFDDVLKTSHLSISVRVNDTWYNDIFLVSYSGYQDKYKESMIMNIPKNGFDPIFYNNLPVQKVSGSFWQ